MILYEYGISKLTSMKPESSTDTFACRRGTNSNRPDTPSLMPMKMSLFLGSSSYECVPCGCSLRVCISLSRDSQMEYALTFATGKVKMEWVKVY